MRISNLKNMQIDTNDIIYIPPDENKKNLDTFLKKGDVILSKTAYPAASIVQLDECNTSQDTVAIKLKTKPLIDGANLVVFLNTKYGFQQMKRWFTGNIQMHLNLTNCKGIYIPVLDSTLQKAITHIFWKSLAFKEDSERAYTQAESHLLSEIGLDGFLANAEKTNTKKLSESFLISGRLDAEYYQPKYEQVINHIKKKEYDTLGNLVNIKKSIEPGSASYSDTTGTPFLRVADYNKFGISEPSKKLTPKFCAENSDRLNKLKPKRGTILFSKDGSVGTAYHLREDMDVITSGAILHLTIKDKSKIIPEYLTLTLNSLLVRMQAERDAGGSIILHWRVGEIEDVVVPIVDFEKQKEIANSVESSFALKAKSDALLCIAKRSMEIAIEKGEKAAEIHISNECTKLGVDPIKG